MQTLLKIAVIVILVGIIICFYQVMIPAVTTPIPIDSDVDLVFSHMHLVLIHRTNNLVLYILNSTIVAEFMNL